MPKIHYETLAEYASESNPDRTYKVKRDPNGTISCSCPAWRFKKLDNDRHCWHTQAVSAMTPEQIQKSQRDAVLAALALDRR